VALGGIGGVLLTPLRTIPTPGGPVQHAMKATDRGFMGFGEAYFSTVEQGAIKAWKRHRRMWSNLIVPVGAIRLKIVDDHAHGTVGGTTLDLTLGSDNYQRLTLPPGLWFGFQGASPGLNLMLNLASIEHDPDEAETLPLDAPAFANVSW
jgi:dTDP-4-dehydrorhamnose 3,5-epimerase